MNDILKKERSKKIKLILLIVGLFIIMPTFSIFSVKLVSNLKKESANNNEQTNNNVNIDNTATLSDDIDFSNININDILSGTWYSCDSKLCYSFTYDNEQNHTIFGLALSNEIFDGVINEIKKINDYRYELVIYHKKMECSDFGKISDEECNKLCSELICNEEYRTYQVDIRDIKDKKIYIKVIGINDYFDDFTLFDNSLGITIPYDENSNVLERFKDNMKPLIEETTSSKEDYVE